MGNSNSSSITRQLFNEQFSYSSEDLKQMWRGLGSVLPSSPSSSCSGTKRGDLSSYSSDAHLYSKSLMPPSSPLHTPTISLALIFRYCTWKELATLCCVSRSFRAGVSSCVCLNAQSSDITLFVHNPFSIEQQQRGSYRAQQQVHTTTEQALSSLSSHLSTTVGASAWSRLTSASVSPLAQTVARVELVKTVETFTLANTVVFAKFRNLKELILARPPATTSAITSLVSSLCDLFHFQSLTISFQFAAPNTHQHWVNEIARLKKLTFLKIGKVNRNHPLDQLLDLAPINSSSLPQLQSLHVCYPLSAVALQSTAEALKTLHTLHTLMWGDSETTNANAEFLTHLLSRPSPSNSSSPSSSSSSSSSSCNGPYLGERLVNFDFLSTDLSQEHLNALPCFPLLTKLHLHTSLISNYSPLASFRHLHSVSLLGADKDVSLSANAQQSLLNAIGQLNELHTIKFRHQALPLIKQVLQLLISNHISLHSISLNHTNIDGAFADSLLEMIKSFDSLQSLTIDHCELIDADDDIWLPLYFTRIVNGAHFPSLHELHIKYTCKLSPHQLDIYQLPSAVVPTLKTFQYTPNIA